jgi:hypothetical protein
VIHGCNGLVEGALDGIGAKQRAIARAKSAGFAFDEAGEQR